MANDNQNRCASGLIILANPEKGLNEALLKSNDIDNGVKCGDKKSYRAVHKRLENVQYLAGLILDCNTRHRYLQLSLLLAIYNILMHM